ncbi:NUC189-domain-containing protein [Polychaeton citri CBS 116435]|uniref:NUC189-domain-containing protein n=1 Tax=Polychaeton citri CBS 116435 TaxID=1314669 RepID=A0A9P4QFV9_9PEZI|nr:NUC189-domain-containing protein [Polychaeton citri CBS 116435]
MSTTKRSRARPSGVSTVANPSSKRRKTTENNHVLEKKGLGFLVDEDARSRKRLDAKLTNGVQASKTSRPDESRVKVAPTSDAQENGQESSDGEDHGEALSQDASDADEEDSHVEASKPATNGHHHSDDSDSENGDVHMGDAALDPPARNEAEENSVLEEPSFADLLQSRYPGTIDVQSAAPFSGNLQLNVDGSGQRALAPPSGTSLTTVLTQALKTDDRDLLESCLHMTDVPSIRSTIQRLPSQHVGTLLERLAERMHKRPGRVGALMVWVQWSLVAHGAFLASQPDIMKRVRSLHYVVKERASGLQSLLHLRGKLDMLSAQLELRRDMQAASRAANANDEEEEEGIIYVDGQEDDWSESEDDAERPALINAPGSKRAKGQTPVRKTDDSAPDYLPNGISHDSESEESEDEDEMEGVIDDEAEEASDDGEGSSAEEDSSASESNEDEDDLSSDEESEVSVQQPDYKKLNRKR